MTGAGLSLSKLFPVQVGLDSSQSSGFSGLSTDSIGVAKKCREHKSRAFISAPRSKLGPIVGALKSGAVFLKPTYKIVKLEPSIPLIAS